MVICIKKIMVLRIWLLPIYSLQRQRRLLFVIVIQQEINEYYIDIILNFISSYTSEIIGLRRAGKKEVKQKLE